MPGKISTCQQQLIDLLNADAFFRDLTDLANPVVLVPVVFKKQGDIEATINERLAEIGVGLVVVFRSAPRLTKEGLELETKFALTGIENPIANETGKSALDVVEAAAEILDGKWNGIAVHHESMQERFTLEASGVQSVPPPRKKPFLDLQLITVSTQIALVPR